MMVVLKQVSGGKRYRPWSIASVGGRPLGTRLDGSRTGFIPGWALAPGRRLGLVMLGSNALFDHLERPVFKKE